MLDKTNGEIIGDLGRGYVKVPWGKWADTAFAQEAVRRAQHAFKNKGAMLPIHISEADILVQEYPLQNRVAFLFQRRIAGEWTYCPVVVLLDESSISQLKMAGRWLHSGGKH